MSERRGPFFTLDQITLPPEFSDNPINNDKRASGHIEDGKRRGGQGLSKKEAKSMEKRGITTDPNLRRLERVQGK